ncbi:MAG: radical SAM protein [Candidatus Methanoperedens sp.]|nr:radical SAM protein [Candidatus Methanoperedens sp.]
MLFDKYCAQIDSLNTDSATKNAMRVSFTRRMELFGNDLHFFREPFTPISLTGTRCSLKCKHCDSYYLGHMLDGSNGKLRSYAYRLAGANGILLSGGSLPDGSVPTYLQADEIAQIKKDTDLKISAHTGIINRGQAELLSKYLDMALVDVIGNDETIHDILGLSATIQDYENTLSHLSSFGIRLAPHIIVGLHNGKLKGEIRALEIARKFDPEAVVIVIFIPTKGTASEGAEPPRIEDVVKVISKAREMFDVPLSLSCVRPGGRYRSMLDKYAILGGIDRMAVPSRSAYRTGQDIGLDIIEIPKMCCSYGV